MGANNTVSENTSFYKLIAKAEKANEKENKAIVQIEKDSSGKYIQTEWFKSISGFIVSMDTKEFEWEGKTKESFILKLQDSGGVYQLEFTNNIAVQGLLNCLLNLDFTKEIEISAWIGKSGFVGAAAKYVGSDTRTEWAIKLEDCPKPIEYTKPSGEKDKDNKNVIAFWRNKFIDMKAKAKRENFKGTTVFHDKLKAPVIKDAPTVGSDDDSDLPF